MCFRVKLDQNCVVWLTCFLSCRLMTNKLLLAIIIVMELAILGAVVYLKFFKKWGGKTSRLRTAVDLRQTWVFYHRLLPLSCSNNSVLKLHPDVPAFTDSGYFPRTNEYQKVTKLWSVLRTVLICLLQPGKSWRTRICSCVLGTTDPRRLDLVPPL